MPVLRQNKEHTRSYEEKLDYFRRCISLGASRQEIQSQMKIGKTTFHKMHKDIALEDKEEAWARVDQHENILKDCEQMLLRNYREAMMNAQNPKVIDRAHYIEIASNLALQITKVRMFGISKVLESGRNNDLVLTDNVVPLQDTNGYRRLQQGNGELRRLDRESQTIEQEKSEVVYE